LRISARAIAAKWWLPLSGQRVGKDLMSLHRGARSMLQSAWFMARRPTQ
jgi:hypothetical protein